MAKTNPEPWKEFEVFNSAVRVGRSYTSPRWFADAQYRREAHSPKTMNIGGSLLRPGL